MSEISGCGKLEKSNRHKTSLAYAMQILTDKKYSNYIEEICLFGSCARNEEKYNSDVDLLIKVSEDFPAKLSRILRASVIPDDPNLPAVDLKFQKRGMDDINSQFHKNIRREGKVLWKRD